MTMWLILSAPMYSGVARSVETMAEDRCLIRGITMTGCMETKAVSGIGMDNRIRKDDPMDSRAMAIPIVAVMGDKATTGADPRTRIAKAMTPTTIMKRSMHRNTNTSSLGKGNVNSNSGGRKTAATIGRGIPKTDREITDDTTIRAIDGNAFLSYGIKRRFLNRICRYGAKRSCISVSLRFLRRTPIWGHSDPIPIFWGIAPTQYKNQQEKPIDHDIH